MRSILILAVLGLAACGEKVAEPYTLYRDSPMLDAARIHFATFNAHEKALLPGTASFNQENCQMTADLLNQNVARLNQGEHPARFWCEMGPFRP